MTDEKDMPEEIWASIDLVNGEPYPGSSTFIDFGDLGGVKYIRADIAGKNTVDAQFDLYDEMNDKHTAACELIEVLVNLLTHHNITCASGWEAQKALTQYEQFKTTKGN